MLMLKNSKSVLIAAEKQPIVFSKQPIVLSLTALWRNQFKSFLNFDPLQIKLKKESLVNKFVLKVDYVRMYGFKLEGENGLKRDFKNF